MTRSRFSRQLSRLARGFPPGTAASPACSHSPRHSAPEAFTWLFDVLLVLLLAAALIRPLFRLKYMDNWSSIESTFISDGRYLKDHWPHPRWQPLWYCGTRWDYIYPPALRYGTAGISRLLGVIPAKAYHIYTAIFYCIGIAGVYVLVRVASRRRGMAWLAAVAAATLSPSCLAMPELRHDVAGSFGMPQRLSVLLRYGEGPHMSAFAIIPLALAAAWVTLRNRRTGMLAAAAVLAALVVSNNFYGATALAIFYPVLVWTLWVTHPGRGLWWRAAAIPALAYGLTAFWLTPSYLRITTENLKIVSKPGNAWSVAVAVVVAVAYGYLSRRMARGRPERAWEVFVWGAFTFFTLNVLGQRYFNFRVAGEPLRLVPELDLVSILAALLVLEAIWRWRPPRLGWAPRAAVILTAAACLAVATRYASHAWKVIVKDEDYTRRIEYRLTTWIAKNLGDARVYPTGSVRFWYNTWYDLPQLGGGSEQGLLNPHVLPAQWDLMMSEFPEFGILWLQCLGVDAVIVNGKRSTEQYHDFAYPNKFAGLLPVIYDSGQDDVIYRVPRRYPGLARVVDTARAARLKPPLHGEDLPNLRAYAELVEKGPEAPAEFRYQGPDRRRIRARVSQGQSILVQETYDPFWRAYSGGRPLPVRRDAFHFMLLDPPPGDHDIEMVFELPTENLVGRLLSGFSAVLVIVLAGVGLRRP